MQGAINMLLSSGIAGVFFGGADIPGYQDTYDSLFLNESYNEIQVVNFYQLGTFFPFMRAHGRDFENHKREPWFFSPQASEAIKAAVFLRYSLIHYLYTTFVEAAQKGVPIMRPMWMEFP